MIQIHLLVFGKLRTPGLAEAANYYARALGAWARVEITELKPTEIRSRADSERERVCAADAALFTARFEKIGGARPFLVLLDEGGKALATEAWATRVREWEGAGLTSLVLGIGGAMGFSRELRARAQLVVSLGPQTLSHELARVVLLEQLYRAWSVTRGHPYHIGG